jgi:hypothetical protein
VLIAAVGLAGQTELARAALKQLRITQFNILLARIASEMPIESEAEPDHDLEAFRRAGLD